MNGGYPRIVTCQAGLHGSLLARELTRVMDLGSRARSACKWQCSRQIMPHQNTFTYAHERGTLISHSSLHPLTCPGSPAL
eukprot:1141077-Pelagomonas_calceolata.AAC.1